METDIRDLRVLLVKVWNADSNGGPLLQFRLP